MGVSVTTYETLFGYRILLLFGLLFYHLLLIAMYVVTRHLFRKIFNTHGNAVSVRLTLIIFANLFYYLLLFVIYMVTLHLFRKIFNTWKRS